MLFILLLAVSCAHVVFSEDYIIPDNINIDDILNNQRLTKNYINCLLEKGSCTPDGEKLKKTIPEALKNDCAKCNEQVKQSAKKVIEHISSKDPENWKLLEAKYDPTGENRKRNQDKLDAYGVKISS